MAKNQEEGQQVKTKLSKKDIEKFKARLVQLRYRLTKTLSGTVEDVKTPDEARGYSQHQADEGTDDFDRLMTLEITSKEFSILKQIDRAMEKIDDNTYGVCDITGKDIPMKRLDAVPYATMTVEAQEKMEKGLL